jgi:anti-sigma factor RsiW
MDERHTPRSDAPDEGELLAAYLDAQTDEVTSARVERLLRQDPRAAARLDAIARTRARLQRLDDVVPPDGFRDRLDARLRAERAESASAQPAQAAQPPSHRARTERRWFRPLVAVAALVLATVVGGGALVNLFAASSGSESADSAFDTAAEAPASGDHAPLSGGDEGTAAERQADGAAGAEEEAQAPSMADAAAPHVDSDADIARRLQTPEGLAQNVPVREAELRAGAGLPVEPACLTDRAATAVDLVERDGELLLVALVDSGDRARVVVFDPSTCTRLRSFAP